MWTIGTAYDVTPMLLRLTYASQLAPGRGQSDIDEIVERAEGANRGRGITGALAFDGTKIIQILEGPQPAVETLFQHIKTDPRHHGVTELSRVPIEAAHFAAWGMVQRPVWEVFMISESL